MRQGDIASCKPLNGLFSRTKTICFRKHSSLLYEGGGQSLQQCIDPSCKAYSIFIGPEGGFSEEEVQFALDLGAKKATLGPRILRTETAPVAALAAIMLTTGNMT